MREFSTIEHCGLPVWLNDLLAAGLDSLSYDLVASTPVPSRSSGAV
jgi:hypothetical protein